MCIHGQQLRMLIMSSIAINIYTINKQGWKGEDNIARGVEGVIAGGKGVAIHIWSSGYHRWASVC